MRAVLTKVMALATALPALKNQSIALPPPTNQSAPVPSLNDHIFDFLQGKGQVLWFTDGKDRYAVINSTDVNAAIDMYPYMRDDNNYPWDNKDDTPNKRYCNHLNPYPVNWSDKCNPYHPMAERWSRIYGYQDDVYCYNTGSPAKQSDTRGMVHSICTNLIHASEQHWPSVGQVLLWNTATNFTNPLDGTPIYFRTGFRPYRAFWLPQSTGIYDLCKHAMNTIIDECHELPGYGGEDGLSGFMSWSLDPTGQDWNE